MSKREYVRTEIDTIILRLADTTMISKIINELADKKVPLSEPLLKLKIVAKRTKNENLFNVVSKELEGYNPEDTLPEYRMATANSFATIQQGWNMYYHQPIPFTLFNDKLKEIFTKFPISYGIEAMENIVSNCENDTIAKVFGADFAAFINSQARKAGLDATFGDIEITTHTSQVIGILGKIRNKFLDLALAIESDFPEIDKMLNEPLEENNEIKTKTNQYMAQINITNSGDGNVINTGSGNEINVSLNVNKNDINSLKESLRKIDVAENDINEISEIIQKETYNVKENKLGQQAQGWIQKMVGKALDGTWKIGIGTAAGVLAKLIASYYGIG